MKQEIQTIPGMRRPTPQEHEWICPQWSKEIRETIGNPGGKAARYAGIVLILVAAAGSFLGREHLAAVVGSLILGCGFLAGYRSSIKRTALRKRLLASLEQGNYTVAPAVSTKIYCGRGERRPMGMMQASLPNGECVDGIIQVPYTSIYPQLCQKLHRIPILLIQIPGYSPVLALPVPDDERK